MRVRVRVRASSYRPKPDPNSTRRLYLARPKHAHAVSRPPPLYMRMGWQPLLPGAAGTDAWGCRH